MQQKTLIKRIGECLSVDVKNIRPDTQLADIEGWDDVGRLLIMSLLEQLFKKTIDQAALMRCRTVEEITDLVRDELEN